MTWLIRKFARWVDGLMFRRWAKREVAAFISPALCSCDAGSNTSSFAEWKKRQSVKEWQADREKKEKEK